MYRDSRKPGLFAIIAAVVLAIVVFAAAAEFRLRVPQEMEEETIASIRNAVQQSALQCYVVEGVYPSELSYLQDNYGLRINTTSYVVAYDAFAENQLPNVKVVKRNR